MIQPITLLSQHIFSDNPIKRIPHMVYGFDTNYNNIMNTKYSY